MLAPDALGPALDRLGGARRTVQVDPSSTAAWIIQRLTAAGATVIRAADPCLLPKAVKNDVELAGARSAHEKDGIALTRFFAWLAREGPAGRLTEISAAERLDALRAEESLFRDVSFPTISGAGPNGAIVHYRATPRTDRRIEPGMLYLVDSGAQYLDGTTDVTRTVAIGPPTAEQRDRFTRVLRGHIALAMARFPKGTTGSQLDALARAPLWDAGLDFDHGTGHGVGQLPVGPRGSAADLQGGQHRGAPPRDDRVERARLLQDRRVRDPHREPGRGHAAPDAAGRRGHPLRLRDPDAGADRPRPVDPALLTPAEIAWLDAYHARVREAIAPKVDPRPPRGWPRPRAPLRS